MVVTCSTGRDTNSTINNESDRQEEEEEEEVVEEEHHEEEEEERLVAPTNQPSPRYKVLDKVYARDKDGLLYEAVVRRCLYGPTHHQQTCVAFHDAANDDKGKDNNDQTSADSAAASSSYNSSSATATWHYFVHFNKWNVKWDRWVLEEEMKFMNPETTAYAERLVREHKALRTAMAGAVKKGKIRANDFLREWKITLERINRQEHQDRQHSNYLQQPTTISGGRSNAGRPNRTTKMTQSRDPSQGRIITDITREIQLRRNGLTQKRNPDDASAIPLPFTLKKNLVEQWEIITQCHMVASIPAEISVRQALDMYLETKGVVTLPKCGATDQNNPTIVPSGGGTSPIMTDHRTSPVVVEPRADTKPPNNKSIEIQGISMNVVDRQQEEEDRQRDLDDRDGDKQTNTPAADSKKENDQEWIDMANGIALLFDEALPSRILYQEERAQRLVLDSMSEYAEMRYSELYGCEHLLRLFIRLPALLSDSIPEEAIKRPLIAKVNDFVRFVHKNQGIILTQTYRKLNELELKERHRQGIKRGVKAGRNKLIDTQRVSSASVAVGCDTIKSEAIVTMGRKKRNTQMKKATRAGNMDGVGSESEYNNANIPSTHRSKRARTTSGISETHTVVPEPGVGSDQDRKLKGEAA